MFEIALETGGRPGVGAEGDGHAGVGDRLQVGERGRVVLPVASGRRAFRDGPHPLRVGELLEHRRIGVLREEGVREEVGNLGIDEGRDLPDERGHIADAGLAHQVEELLVHRPVADAVRDQRRAGPEHFLGVVEIEDVGRHGDAGLFGQFHHGFDRLRGDAFVGAQVGVHPHLEEVGGQGEAAGHGLAGLFRRAPADHLAGDPEAGAVEPLVLFVPQSRRFGPVPAERQDARDAVAGVETELAQQVLPVVVPALEPLHIADVPVRVEEAGNHGLPGEVGGNDARRDLDFAARPDAGDAAVLGHEHGVLEEPPAPVPQRRAGPGGHAFGGRGRRGAAGAEDESGEGEERAGSGAGGRRGPGIRHAVEWYARIRCEPVERASVGRRGERSPHGAYWQPVEKAPRRPLLDARTPSPRSVSRRGALPTGRRRESLRDSPRHRSRGGGHPLPAPLPGRRFAPTGALRTFSTGS